jgi:hypothetical protein
VNNFSIGWKLVFVAAVVLVLSAGVLLFSAPAFAQPLRVASSDLVASYPSSSTLARRAARPGGVEQERRLSPGPIIGLVCAIVASSAALGVAFGLRRRMDRIAGPDPETVDDD